VDGSSDHRRTAHSNGSALSDVDSLAAVRHYSEQAITHAIYVLSDRSLVLRRIQLLLSKQLHLSQVKPRVTWVSAEIDYRHKSLSIFGDTRFASATDKRLLSIRLSVCTARESRRSRRSHETDSSLFPFTSQLVPPWPTGGRAIDLAITYLEAMSERQSRIARAAINAAEATQLASLQAALSFSQALVWSPLVAARFITQATLSTFGLVEQQTALTRQPNDKLVKPLSHATPSPQNASHVTTPDHAEQRAAVARKTIDDAAPTLITTTDEDEQIELRAERLVIDKQPVRHSEVRVRKKIVTEMQSIDVPVTHEELVIDRHAVTGGVGVEGEPIADATIRIPLTQERVNITKETVVREEVEIGKRRIEDVEHISDTVRHEELHVDDATTVTADDAEPAFVTAAEDAAPAFVTAAEDAAPAFVTVAEDAAPAFVTAAEDAAPAFVTVAEDAALALATMADDGAPAFATTTAEDAAQALATGLDDAAEAFIATADDAALVATANDAPPVPVATTDQDQEIELRAERLVVNKQRGQNGKARVRKEIVTEKKSIDVPVSHEEIVIDRHAVTGDVDVDSAPIADETIRIPLTEEQVDISKETVVREEVEIGTRRIEDVEHISDTVRHEELRVDDAPTNHYHEPAF
jgi:uncharacterized protein (TIGR02271 family)